MHDLSTTTRTPPSWDQLLDDQSRCWARGEPQVVEAYLRDHPELAGDRSLVLDLICHEMLLRSRRGEVPELVDYLARFPGYADDLEAQFAVRAALEAAEGPVTVLGTLRAEPGRSFPPQAPGYEIQSELGRGAMGVVYLARHRGLGRLVALKMIQTAAFACSRQLARFRGEAEVLARLHHPNVIQIYDVGECDGRPFLALEYLPGGGLERRLRGNPQPPAQAAQLLLCLAQAVEAAHQAGVIHRDLKPANILFDADDNPRITDFGLARRLDGVAQTTTGDILGTPHYMAPEQAYGDRGDVGPWTDVYALGAIFYELLTGRPPFNGSTVWDTLEQMASVDPVAPSRLQSRVPRDLEVICLKCLAKRPERRYGRAADLAEDLRRHLAGEPIRARPTSVGERVWKWCRRRPGRATLVGLFLVFLFALPSGICTWLKLTANQARLEAHEARDREAAALARADLRDGFAALEASCVAGRWPEAASHLDGLARQLNAAEQAWPGDSAFVAMRARLGSLGRTVERQQTSRDQLLQFRKLRTECGFLVIGLAGTTRETRLVRARSTTEAALSLANEELQSGPAKGGESSALSREEQQELREGCCELLLGLAQLTVEADSTPAGIDDALTLIDRAGQGAVAPGMCQARRAQLLARLGRAEEARVQRVLAAAHPPSRAFEFFLAGNDRYLEGDLRGAAEAFERALGLEPDHAAAAYALALPHLRLVQAEEQGAARAHLVVARMSLTACIKRQPDLPWPYLCRAFAQGELGETTAAEADFARAEQILQDHPDAAARYALLVSRGALHIRQGNLDSALADLKEAVALEPLDYQAHVNLARAYQGRADERDALSHFDRALTLAPPTARSALYRTRARLHQEAGRLTEAAHDLAEAARLEPGGTRSPAAVDDQFARGRLLARAHDYEGACNAFGVVLEARPDHPGAARARAEVLIRLHRPAEALVDLSRLLDQERARQREEAPVVRARAGLRARMGDHRGAVEDYTLALHLNSDSVTYTARAWEYLTLEAAALALADCEQALHLRPDDADARLARATALVKLGVWREAVDEVEQVRHQRPLGQRDSYHAAGVYSLASRLLSQDKTTNPETRELARAYQQRALTLLEDALSALPSPERQEFWNTTLRCDPALEPLRSCPGYRRLVDLIPVRGKDERP